MQNEDKKRLNLMGLSLRRKEMCVKPLAQDLAYNKHSINGAVIIAKFSSVCYMPKGRKRMPGTGTAVNN